MTLIRFLPESIIEIGSWFLTLSALYQELLLFGY